MASNVEYYFDFGSPNAYLSHLVIPSIEARSGVKFEYIPILLGGVFKMTNNLPPIMAFKEVKNKLEYLQLETERFIKKHEITDYQFNPHFPVNTLQVMRGAIVAGMHGYFDKYVDEVFHHMWAEPKKMDDPQVIQTALESSALPALQILEGIQQPEVKRQLLKNSESLVSKGGFGAPSFFIGNNLYFGKNCLPEIEETIRSHS